MNAVQNEATKTVSLIKEGKIKNLVALIPENQSPKLYLDLVKSQVMGLDKQRNPRPDEDLLLFLYVCKRTGLDPLTRQIFAVYRWNTSQGREVMSIQTGIDGMRLVAQRSNAYAGQDEIKFLPEDESAPYPVKATCTVYKMIQGQKVGFTASARWSEYVQQFNGKVATMWAKMPYTMLGKCAEALALRKGFPNELSGIYSREEMAQSAVNIVGNLEAPDRFKRPEGVEVVHGKPDKAEAKKTIGTEEALKATKKKRGAR